MKEYGDEKSWSKEYVMEKDQTFESDDFCCCCGGYREVVYPIKVFRDGDILMAYSDECTIDYSNKTKAIAQTDIFGLGDEFDFGGMEAMLHTSSLLAYEFRRGECKTILMCFQNFLLCFSHA